MFLYFQCNRKVQENWYVGYSKCDTDFLNDIYEQYPILYIYRYFQREYLGVGKNYSQILKTYLAQTAVAAYYVAYISAEM